MHREKELSRREKVLEEKSIDLKGKAREEASAALGKEMEALARDRASLEEERVRFNEEKKSQSELVAGSVQAYSKIREMQAVVLAKEEELLIARQEVLALESARNDDEAKVAEMLNVPVDALLGPMTKEYLMKLMRHVTDLKEQGEENKTVRRNMKEAVENNQRLESQNKKLCAEIQRLKGQVRQVQEKFKVEMTKAEEDIKTIENSKLTLSGKVTSLIQRNAELENLLENQRYASNRLDRLQRVNRKFHHSAGARDAGSPSGPPLSTSRAGDKFFSSEVDSLLYKPKSALSTSRYRSPIAEGRDGSRANILSVNDVQNLVEMSVAAELAAVQKKADHPPPHPPHVIQIPQTTAFTYPHMNHASMYMPPPMYPLQPQPQPSSTVQSSQNGSSSSADMTALLLQMLEQQKQLAAVPSPPAFATRTAPIPSTLTEVSDESARYMDEKRVMGAPEMEVSVPVKAETPVIFPSSLTKTPKKNKEKEEEEEEVMTGSPSHVIETRVVEASCEEAETSRIPTKKAECVNNAFGDEAEDNPNGAEKENPTCELESEESIRQLEAERAIAYNREQARLEEERAEAARRLREEQREAERKEREELEKECKRKEAEERERELERQRVAAEEKERQEEMERERVRLEAEMVANDRQREEEEKQEAERVEREAILEKQRKEEEDRAAVKAARDRVLARRNKKKEQETARSLDSTSSTRASGEMGGGWSSARRLESPKNSNADTSVNRSTQNDTYDDIQTGFDPSPRARDNSFDSGW